MLRALSISVYYSWCPTNLTSYFRVMYVPSLSTFQIIATIILVISICTALKTLNEAESWNRCGQTLTVNHCPYQTPEDTAKCRQARRQMDEYEIFKLRMLKRNVTEQKTTLYVMSATAGSSILSYIIYMALPLNGQLCLGKVYNIAASMGLSYSVYSTIVLILYHNEAEAAYGEKLCSLESTIPIFSFNSPDLKICFQSYYLCQNAILAFGTTGLNILAAFFYFLAFFSACWDCHTQVDRSDWGVLEDLPEYLREQQPEPPRYFLEEAVQDPKHKKKYSLKKPEKETKKTPPVPIKAQKQSDAGHK